MHRSDRTSMLCKKNDLQILALFKRFGLKGKSVETIAVYWEDKPKTYGFIKVADLALLDIEIQPDEIAQWGLFLYELSDLNIKFHLVCAQFSSRETLRMSILFQTGFKDSLFSCISERSDTESVENIHLTSSVELIYFHGPHFGDRYGIAHTACKALDDANIPILINVCSGAAVLIVLPENSLEKAGNVLSEVFEVV